SGGSSTTQAGGPGAITSITFDNAGVGYREDCAVVAFDGTWLFEVSGVDDGETVPDSAAGTNRGTDVYLTSAGALTLTSAGNTFFGKVDDGNIVDGVAPVQIGVTA